MILPNLDLSKSVRLASGEPKTQRNGFSLFARGLLFGLMAQRRPLLRWRPRQAVPAVHCSSFRTVADFLLRRVRRYPATLSRLRPFRVIGNPGGNGRIRTGVLRRGGVQEATSEPFLRRQRTSAVPHSRDAGLSRLSAVRIPLVNDCLGFRASLRLPDS